MITLSPTSALMLYLFLTLFTVMSLWVANHLKKSRKKIIPDKQDLLVCEYCQTAYIAQASKSVTQCPTCHTYNKNNRFTKSRNPN